MKKNFVLIGSIAGLFAMGLGISYFAPLWVTDGIIIVLLFLILSVLGSIVITGSPDKKTEEK